VCRMVGFCFETNQEINGFFEHLQRMAKMGKNAPHNHGWGIYALFDDAVIYYRSPKSVYEEELIPLKARVGILHARKASEHLPVSFISFIHS